jgi:hypothetical protein
MFPLITFSTGPFLLTYEEGTKQGKAVPVTGREGPQGCETSRLPHFL